MLLVRCFCWTDRDQEDRIDPMVYIFPRLTKYTFHKFGTSGELEKHDALCILPLNIFNEKIYLFKLRYRRVKPDCVEIVMDKTGVGDWFLLYLLGQNIDHIVFKDVFHELAKKLGYRSKDLTDP